MNTVKLVVMALTTGLFKFALPLLMSLLISLSYVSQAAEQSTNSNSKTPNKKASSIAMPAAIDKQHQSDLKHYLQESQALLVGSEEVSLLVKQSQSANSKGVFILLPDWQLSATDSKSTEFLRNKLPELGWVTITIQPFAKPDNYPSTALTADERDKDNQTLLADYQSKLAQVLEQVFKQAQAYPGIIITLAQGNNGAFLTTLYQQQKLKLPNALILLSAYQSDHDLQAQFAEQLSTLDLPTLDLWLRQDHPYLNEAIKLRKQAADKAIKLDYRQRQLLNIQPGYYPEQSLVTAILAWLKSIGW